MEKQNRTKMLNILQIQETTIKISLEIMLNKIQTGFQGGKPPGSDITELSIV